MSDNRAPSGKFFWICFAVGASIALFGIWTLLLDVDRNKPLYTAALAVSSNIVHDAVIAPMVCATGFVVSRTVRKTIRPQVNWALFASAISVAIAFAPLRGYGRNADNPTVLPLDYSTAVLTVIGVIWAIAAIWSVASLMLKRHAVNRA